MAYIGKVVAGGATHLVGSTLYGTCSTAAGTVAKVVVSTDFTELVTGVTIHIKFAETNTATSPTLTIQNAASNPTYTTGAKAIMKYGTTAAGTTAATSWYAGTVVALTYDGTNWIMNDHIDDTNTDTKVTQTATTANAEYEVLFSATADNTTRTEAARKSDKLKFNPSTGTLTATKVTTPTITLNGSDLGTTLSELTAKEQQNENNILLLEQMNGAKNQINIPDGTYTAGTSSYSVTNGAVTSTATDNTTHAVDLSIWTLKAGTYVFYDDSSDLSAVQYRIYKQSPDTRLTPAGQNPATFTLANDTVVYLSCYTFKTGTMTTRPMLMTKAMWDAGFTDYQPYALSNAELTAKEHVNENNISSLTDKYNRLGNVIYAKPLSELTFTKSLGGLYYSNDIDISNDFYEVYAAGLENFSNVPNVAFNIMVRNNLTLVVVVCDPTNPATLSFSAGSITMRVFGRAK